MKIIALTGGVGMGKSTAGRLLQERGLPVVDTDVLARRVVEPDQPAWREIVAAFGPEIAGPDGQLRREELARRAFSDVATRQKLESITHPRIRELWRKEIELWRAEARRGPGVVVIPLLFEIGAEGEFDATICVACSAVTQRQRLRERGWTDEHMARRIAAQWPVEKKMARADFVVWNEGAPDLLGEQLDFVLRSVRRQAFAVM